MNLLNNDTLLLRALEPEDLDLFYQWENDTSLWKYGATLSPYSRYTLKEYLATASPDIYKNNQLRFIIERKEDMLAAGTIDLYDFEPHHRRAGVGILVDARFRSQGIAGQALALLVTYAFDFLKLHQLYAHIPTSNPVSITLFERCGFIKTGVLKEWISVQERYEDVCVMQLIN